MIEEFYAVTLTSVYRVFVNPLLKTEAVAQKVAVRGGSAIGVGDMIGGGTMIGITRKGLIAYTDHIDPPRPCESVNTRYWGGRSSWVVGLFLDKDQAQACFEQGSDQEADPRWQAETKQALDAIGDAHPCFIPSKMEELRFPVD